MDSSQCWALAPWAAMLSQLMQSRDRALLQFQPGACSRGPWETPELQPCTERAGKGAGTSPLPVGTRVPLSLHCCSHFPCWKGDGCSSEQVSGSQAVWPHRAQNNKASWTFAEKLLLMEARSLLGWFLVSPGSRSLPATLQAVGALLRGWAELCKTVNWCTSTREWHGPGQPKDVPGP